MYGVGCRLLWGRAEVFCKAVITAVSVIFAHARVLEHRTELAMLQVRDKDQSSSETQFSLVIQWTISYHNYYECSCYS